MLHSLRNVVYEAPFSLRAVDVVAYVFHDSAIDVEEARKEGDDERTEGERFGHAFRNNNKCGIVDQVNVLVEHGCVEDGEVAVRRARRDICQPGAHFSLELMYPVLNFWSLYQMMSTVQEKR